MAKTPEKRGDLTSLEKVKAFFAARLALFILILLTTIFLRQDVLGTPAIVQIYLALAATFAISLVLSVFWDATIKSRFLIPALIFYDLLLTSYLVYLTGIESSIFLFVYLFNIAFASVAYQLPGSLSVAVTSGLIYFFIYCANNDMDEISAWNNLAWNELLFLLSALLCGQFMDELKRQKALLAAQKESIASLERLNERLLNSIPLGILLVNGNEQVEKINETALSILKLDAPATLGRKYHDLAPDLRGILTAWEQMTETQKLRFTFRSAEDGPPHLSLRLVPLKSGTKGREQYIIVFQDISQLQELEKKLEFESKLAATGELAAGIAHEIRNPLASISGSIELLGQSPQVQCGTDRKLVDIALLEIKRLNHLITDFLEFAKPKNNSGGDFPLGALVDEVAAAMKSRGEPFRILNQVPAGTVIHANRERIKQVFFNLFINSLEASVKEETEIVVSAALNPEGSIEILVRDNGPGITAGLAERVFDPFFTTKANGTGLGLPTVAQIIRAAKGKITLEAGPSGASFRILLPASSTMEMASSAS